MTRGCERNSTWPWLYGKRYWLSACDWNYLGWFYLLCGLFAMRAINLFLVAEKFYWDHQGIILSTIGVVIVLVIANAIGKNSE